jgi:hypothetical protein
LLGLLTAGEAIDKATGDQFIDMQEVALATINASMPPVKTALLAEINALPAGIQGLIPNVTIAANSFNSNLYDKSSHQWDIVKIYNPKYVGDVIKKICMCNVMPDIDWTLIRQEKTQKEIETLLDSMNKKSEDRLNLLEDDLKKYKNLLKYHEEKMEELRSSERELNEIYSSASIDLSKNREELNELGRRIRNLNSDKCPTCEIAINTDFHMNLKDSLLESKVVAEREMEKLNNSLY